MRNRSIAVSLSLIGIPVSLLGLSYVWLALDHQTWWLWDVTVHESGLYTLKETVFYFRHFVREIAVDVAMALFLLAAFVSAGGLGARSKDIVRPVTASVIAFVVALMILTIGLLGAIEEQGWRSTVDDLLQYRTRDYLSEYGSHWHFHWLSTLWFAPAGALVAPYVVSALGGDVTQSWSKGRRLWWLAWGYFAALTVLFGLSSKIFLDVRYAGHQAREIMTHGPVAGLLAFGALYLCAVWFFKRRPLVDVDSVLAGLGALTWPSVTLFFGIPLYLAIVTLTGDFEGVSQSDHGLAAMVGAHFFEHMLDYLLVMALVVGSYGWMVARQGRGERS